MKKMNCTEKWTLVGLIVIAVLFVLLSAVSPVQAGLVPPTSGGGGGGGSGGSVSTSVQMPTQTNISSSHQNYIPGKSGNGHGNIYGAIIPEQLYASGETWWMEGRLHFSVTASVSGSFMPEGTVSPEMLDYQAIGEQSTEVSLATSKVTFWDNGEWYEASFARGLDANLNLSSNVVCDTWEDEEGSIDYWRGMANVWMNVGNGFINNSSSNFWRTDYNDRPSEWQAQFRFSGIAMPGEVTITPMAVPEPATAALLGAGTIFFRRRRR